MKILQRWRTSKKGINKFGITNVRLLMLWTIDWVLYVFAIWTQLRIVVICIIRELASCLYAPNLPQNKDFFYNSQVKSLSQLSEVEKVANSNYAVCQLIWSTSLSSYSQPWIFINFRMVIVWLWQQLWNCVLPMVRTMKNVLSVTEKVNPRILHTLVQDVTIKVTQQWSGINCFDFWHCVYLFVLHDM